MKEHGEVASMVERGEIYKPKVHPFRGFSGEDCDYGRVMRFIRKVDEENKRKKLGIRQLKKKYITSMVEQNMPGCTEVMDQVLKRLEEDYEEKQMLEVKSMDYETQIEQLNKVKEKLAREIADLEKEREKLRRNQNKTKEVGKAKVSNQTYGGR